jgi:hypothetical protein
MALTIFPALEPYNVSNLNNGICRPTNRSNAWVADINDQAPSVTLAWKEPIEISRIVLFFDSDFDHPLESTLRVHPERVVPHTVKNYKIMDADGQIVYERAGNYQTINEVLFNEKLKTSAITVHLQHPSSDVPAALFEVQVY